MDNALGLFGLAKRAGRAEIGEKPAQSAAASKKARAIFTASDASENTLKTRPVDVPVHRNPTPSDAIFQERTGRGAWPGFLRCGRSQ